MTKEEKRKLAIRNEVFRLKLANDKEVFLDKTTREEKTISIIGYIVIITIIIILGGILLI